MFFAISITPVYYVFTPGARIRPHLVVADVAHFNFTSAAKRDPLDLVGTLAFTLQLESPHPNMPDPQAATLVPSSSNICTRCRTLFRRRLDIRRTSCTDPSYRQVGPTQNGVSSTLEKMFDLSALLTKDRIERFAPAGRNLSAPWTGWLRQLRLWPGARHRSCQLTTVRAMIHR
jgi:hypothetical protein